MTSRENPIVTVEHSGIVCKSDFCLYDEKSGTNNIQLLSIYGAMQQVKGLFACLAAGKALLVGEIMLNRSERAICFKGTKIGYAKYHGLVWTEDVGKNMVIWTSEDQRIVRLRQSLLTRRIPFEPHLIERIEKMLLREGYIRRLLSWGGTGGYLTQYDDDKICDLILSDIYQKETITKVA